MSKDNEINDPIASLNLTSEEIAQIPDAVLEKLAVSCALIARRPQDDTPHRLAIAPKKRVMRRRRRRSGEAKAQGRSGGQFVPMERTISKYSHDDYSERVKVLGRTVSTAMHLFDARREALSERNIEKLLDMYLEGEKRSDIDDAIELDNARLRAEYLNSVKTLTSLQINRQSGSKTTNQSEPASRWKREGRIFGVRWNGVDHYPKFQFKDGQPRPEIKAILKKMPEHMSSWQVAFWFVSGNSWLDDNAPQDILADDGIDLALKALNTEVIG